MINFMRKLGDNRTVGAKGGRCMGAERRPREMSLRQRRPEKQLWSQPENTGFQDQRCRKQVLSAQEYETGS